MCVYSDVRWTLVKGQTEGYSMQIMTSHKHNQINHREPKASSPRMECV